MDGLGHVIWELGYKTKIKFESLPETTNPVTRNVFIKIPSMSTFGHILQYFKILD